jgi:transcriptional regulator with XRE-family HTH domain
MIGDKIRELRATLGYTQADLADKIGVSRQTIINWEKGVTGPDKAEIDLLGITFDTDLTKEGKMSKTQVPEEFYRDLIESNSEYRLIPKSVLEEKYRIVPLSEIEDARKKDEEKTKLYYELISSNDRYIESLEIQIKDLKQDLVNARKPLKNV